MDEKVISRHRYKWLITLILFLGLTNELPAQSTELLKNGDMESPGELNQEFPNNCAQISRKKDEDRLSNWRSKVKEKKFEGEKVKLHSPEWFRTTTYISGNTTNNNLFVKDPVLPPPGKLIPSGGSGYIGMGECELVQQKLEIAEFVTDQDYQVRLSFRLRTSFFSITDGVTNFYYCSQGPMVKTAKLRVWISRKRWAYSVKANNPQNACSGDYCNKSSSTDLVAKQKIMEVDLDESVYSDEVWHTVTSTFTAPHFAQKYNWLIIEVSEAENFCSSYVLIDDVSLMSACEAGCTNGCSPTDGPAGNVVVQSTITYQNPFWFEVPDNIHTAQLTIFPISGQSAVYTSPEYYCSNGIRQRIEYNGLNLGFAPYKYEIRTKNDCFKNCSVTGQMQKQEEFTGTLAPFNCYTGPIIVPDPCCPLEPDIYIDNVTFPSTQNFTDGFTFDYEAQNDINVATTGNVTVQAGAEVTFQAGNSINITTNNYDEELGAEVSKIIVPCPQGKMNYTGNGLNGMEPDSLVAPTVTRHIDLEEPVDKEPGRDDDALSDDPDSMMVKVYPNPSNGRWFKTYLVNVSGKLKIEVIDGLGVARQIDQVNRSSPDHSTFTCTISGDPLSSGIYTVRISGGEEVVLGKLVVVR